MNILCLGCSYTAGMPEQYYSWAEKLSKIRSKDKVYNLAIGGSSVTLSLYLLEEFSKLITADIIIFQITHPHRFSRIGDFQVNLDSLYNTNNYYRLDPNIRANTSISTIVPGNARMQWTKDYQKIKFAKNYYRFYSKELGNLEHNILVNAIKEKSNFSFEYNNIPNIARQNVIDDAGHFNNLGHDIIAEWVNNELERNIH